MNDTNRGRRFTAKQLAALLLLSVIAPALAAPQDNNDCRHLCDSGETKGLLVAQQARSQPQQNSKQLERLIGRKINFKPTNMQPITVTGEVIDVWCYMSETMGPGRGAKHQSCAAACGNGGVPLGIVEDKTGQVYIAAKSTKPYKGCNEVLLPYVAKTITVKGFVARKGGCQVLRIQEIVPSKP